jgi:putative ABC transport system substrate-binding protein
MIRRSALAWLAAALAPMESNAFFAQAATRVRRIGVLGNTDAYVRLAEWKSFVDELERRGQLEGRDVEFVHRYAGTYAEPEASKRLARLAAELVAMKVDLIYAVDDGGSGLAARNATRTIPIVFDHSWHDPVEAGLVASLARPGANVTGNATLGAQLEHKTIQLLVEAVGKGVTVGAVHSSALKSWPQFPRVSAARQAAARAVGVRLEFFEADTVDDLRLALPRMLATGIRAAKFDDTEEFSRHRGDIAALFRAHRMAAISSEPAYARAGLLLAFGWDAADIARRSAAYVDRILRGAKPSDLPVEQVARINLVVNLTTARAIGLIMPPSLLARADEVIE